MRLEPVFLVEPRPTPQAVPTRRAFLLAGGAFAFGSVIGGACGYSIGAAKGDAVEAAGEKDGEEKLTPSGDARLDALRRMAVKAPIEDLVKNWNEWWGEFWFNYDTDQVLWQGVDRLADWASSNSSSASYELLSALVMACQNERRGPSTTLLSHRKTLETERLSRKKKR